MAASRAAAWGGAKGAHAATVRAPLRPCTAPLRPATRAGGAVGAGERRGGAEGVREGAGRGGPEGEVGATSGDLGQSSGVTGLSQNSFSQPSHSPVATQRRCVGYDRVHTGTKPRAATMHQGEYVRRLGTCRGAFDLASPLAQSSDSQYACMAACTAVASCRSASWYAPGPTSLHGVSSQCWLSTRCVRPTCCYGQPGFVMFVRSPPRHSTAPNAPMRAGVCVTGEARSFRYPGVRQSLHTLLKWTGSEPHALSMTLARRSSCQGLLLRKNGTYCRMTADRRFDVPLEVLQREFPGASITLLEESSCANERHAEEPCCKPSKKEGRATLFRPGFLQAVELVRCAELLLEKHAEAVDVAGGGIRTRPELHAGGGRLLVHGALRGPLTHIVRTRPDVVYLGSGAAFDLRSITRPTMVRKAEPGSLVGASGPIEISQPDHRFIAVPIDAAAAYFGSLIDPMRAMCARGSYTIARTLVLEAFLQRAAAAVYANESADGAASSPAVIFRGVECEAGRKGSAQEDVTSTLTEQCIKSFPTITVTADGEPRCQRMADGPTCDAEARAIVAAS